MTRPHLTEPVTFIVTIDGPAGSGKTTVSRLVADQLGFDYIDTGALYRGIAFSAVQSRIDLKDEIALEKLCQTISIRLNRSKDGLRLVVNDADITGKIRTPDISMAASAVSACLVVRQYLLKLQRDLGCERRAVFEGRDMGTVVFPDANIKFFLNADVDVRAQRRFEELAGTVNLTFELVKAVMVKRDSDDTSRALAPLKAAFDAVRLDTTHLSIDTVVKQIIEKVNDAMVKI